MNYTFYYLYSRDPKTNLYSGYGMIPLSLKDYYLKKYKIEKIIEVTMKVPSLIHNDGYMIEKTIFDKEKL